MCGICVVISHIDDEHCNLHKSNSFNLLKRRGPNYFETEKVKCGNSIYCTFHASVLHLRGSSCVLQPFTDEFGNKLLWNGEIFGGPLYTEETKSDTIILAESLIKAKSAENIINVFDSINGPWAFIYYQKEESLLWFGRDLFGRRSLLWNLSSCGSCFSLSSIALTTESWTDVPCDGIYCFDISKTQELRVFSLYKYPYATSPSGAELENLTNVFTSTDNINVQIADPKISHSISTSLNHALSLHLVGEDFVNEINGENLLKVLLETSEWTTAVTEFEKVLNDAVRCRVLNHLFICRNCFLLKSPQCNHASVAVLFSGGIDSMVIAALADRFLPEFIPIDLLNVAFSSMKDKSQKRNDSDKSDLSNADFETPDRITGKSGLEELKQMSPKRLWNFVMINVTVSELEQEREKMISKLIKPSCTVLDDSIGCAIWFAARGLGCIDVDGSLISYCSPTRVVLVGMGADEQLAGYSRHRVKFGSHGWTGLIDELALELDRISSRNLGRDDRIISDHGREARFPFLDENVVSFLNGLPVWLKANLHYPRGVGEKLLLRLLAYKLGLKNTALLPKRAIQFGSRIARCENSKEKGSDVCRHLKSHSTVKHEDIT